MNSEPITISELKKAGYEQVFAPFSFYGKDNPDDSGLTSFIAVYVQNSLCLVEIVLNNQLPIPLVAQTMAELHVLEQIFFHGEEATAEGEAVTDELLEANGWLIDARFTTLKVYRKCKKLTPASSHCIYVSAGEKVEVSLEMHTEGKINIRLAVGVQTMPHLKTLEEAFLT